jgi:chaperonin GroES
MHMALKPLQDNILVEPAEGEEKTEGGIYLPDTAKEKPQKGKIISVGPGKMVEGKLQPVNSALKPGVMVLYKKYATTEVKDGGKELLLVDEDGILAIVA